jgi:hypothetical protein
MQKRPAPKEASDFERLSVSLKRYPDTNREFFSKRKRAAGGLRAEGMLEGYG